MLCRERGRALKRMRCVYDFPGRTRRPGTSVRQKEKNALERICSEQNPKSAKTMPSHLCRALKKVASTSAFSALAGDEKYVPRLLDNIGPRGERGAAVLKLGYMAEERQKCGCAAEDRNTTSAPLRCSHAAPSTINFKKLHLR